MQRDLMRCFKGLQCLFLDRKTCLMSGMPCAGKAFHETHCIFRILDDYSILSAVSKSAGGRMVLQNNFRSPHDHGIHSG